MIMVRGEKGDVFFYIVGCCEMNLLFLFCFFKLFSLKLNFN